MPAMMAAGPGLIWDELKEEVLPLLLPLLGATILVVLFTVRRTTPAVAPAVAAGGGDQRLAEWSEARDSACAARDSAAGLRREWRSREGRRDH